MRRKLGRAGLVLAVVVLVGLGLNQSARGINSLTLNQESLVMIQRADDIVTVQALGESYSLDRRAVQEKEQELGQMLQRQAWRSTQQMGQALAAYISLVY